MFKKLLTTTVLCLTITISAYADNKDEDFYNNVYIVNCPYYHNGENIAFPGSVTYEYFLSNHHQRTVMPDGTPLPYKCEKLIASSVCHISFTGYGINVQDSAVERESVVREFDPKNNETLYFHPSQKRNEQLGVLNKQPCN